MADIRKYKKGIKVQLSKNFNSTEFDSKGGYPDEEWTIIDLDHVKRLQLLRDKLNKACTITSAYRAPTHNKKVGGVSNSRHTKGDATDVQFSGVSPTEVAKAAKEIGFTGIGIYDTFTHVDSRPGRLAEWDFRTKK